MKKFLAYKDSGDGLVIIGPNDEFDYVHMVSDTEFLLDVLVSSEVPVPATPVFALIICN